MYRLRIKYCMGTLVPTYFIYFRHWRDVGTLSTADSTGEPVRRRPAAAGESQPAGARDEREEHKGTKVVFHVGTHTLYRV